MLRPYLDILAREFPSAQWEPQSGDSFEGAILRIAPLSVKVVLFTEDYRHLHKGDVTLSLHAGRYLAQMFGTPTSNGKATTRCCKNLEQFEKATTELCDELLSMATAILTITDKPPDEVDAFTREAARKDEISALIETTRSILGLR